MFPRSTFGLAALCLTLFSSLLWYSSSRFSSSSVFERKLNPGLSHSSRASSTPPSIVRANVVVDEPADDPIWDIQNRTLGFHKIYAISMPHRSDKHDYLALMGLVSELDIDFVDGVDGSLVSEKAVPYFWIGDNGAGTIGCWRAHLNIYQTMVREKIQSALVLEDDADWDVLLKAQMTEFARGTRHLQNATLPLHSPYGDNWDLLTIGHNGVNNKPHREQKYWVTQNDPTVIAPSRRNWSRMPDLSAPALGGDHTRVVHEVGKMTATQAYAISLRGAARLLYDQSMAPHAQAIDMAMLQLCRRDVWGPTPFCLGAYPMLFGRFRAAGPMDKDSDRRVLTEEVTPGAGRVRNATRMNHESEFTVFPISLNIEKLLKNDPIIPAQVPDSDLLKEVDLREFVLPRGRPVFVRPDEYVDRQKEAAAAGKPLKAPEPVPVDPAVVE